MPTVIPYAAYIFFDIVNVCIGAATLIVFVGKYYSTYDKDKDNFGINAVLRLNILPKTGPLKDGPLAATAVLYGAVAVIGLLWHFVRGSPHSFGLSYFCCVYEVMGALALLPQLWMFHVDKRVSPLLGQFVVLTAINRICTLSFWYFYPWVFLWRYPDNRNIQMLSETLNILILSDFLFYFVRSKLRGESEIIIGIEPEV